MFSSSVAELSKYEFEELLVPVPYGHLSCIAWGPKSGFPVLAVHGWLDNANSFLPLVQYLPEEWRVVAMDLTGHGRSSHWPDGAAHINFDYVFDVRRVVDFFGWEKLSLMGHSMGAATCLSFAASHPEKIRNLCLIEGFHPIPSPVESIATKLRDALDGVLLHEALRNRPEKIYSEEQALERLLAGNSNLNRDAALLLLHRATKPADGGVIFTRDHRLRASSPLSLSMEQARALVKAVNTNVLFIQAKDGFKGPAPDLDLVKKPGNRVEHVVVPGEHHIHMLDPQAPAALIHRFFSQSSHL